MVSSKGTCQCSLPHIHDSNSSNAAFIDARLHSSSDRHGLNSQSDFVPMSSCLQTICKQSAKQSTTGERDISHDKNILFLAELPQNKLFKFHRVSCASIEHDMCSVKGTELCLDCYLSRSSSKPGCSVNTIFCITPSIAANCPLWSTHT